MSVADPPRRTLRGLDADQRRIVLQWRRERRIAAGRPATTGRFLLILLGICLLTGVVTLGGSAFVWLFIWEPNARIPLIGTGLSGLVAIVMVIARLSRPESARQAGRSVCPICIYPLASIPVEADGCSVCPECGAAWRVNATSPVTASRPEP
jgi:hypothetical protein